MNESYCWHCDKIFEYDGEKYRDINCPHCGVLNSIYNPADLQPIEEKGEEKMGKLADRAREKSPYIKLEIGEESPVLIYKAWKEATDNFGNETFRYIFEQATDSGMVTKQLDNRSQSFAEAMDKIVFGEKVMLKREPKLDHEGEVIENKSVWTVRKVE